ncbi:sugar phosphate isomerase/epimerase family protein [Streptomyces sp. NPDC017520]|uniref:sugar phosphate isomerase/epimerase family protein n=1 Tax=Streptomyces sp. NPDC017520 TaxID=3364998 RepID=UPI0037A6A12E
MSNQSRINIQSPSRGEPVFGAGVWHFATYVDRYATDGYGEQRTVLDAIKLAGSVGDLSVLDLNWPFPPGGISTAEVRDALAEQNLRAIAVTPEIYTGQFAKGGFTNPDPVVRRQAIDLVAASAQVGRELGVDYIKIWPGQDGYDYPFQADYSDLWTKSVDALRELAQSFPGLKFAIEYKPREPRNRMFFSSAARTLLAIQDMGVDNVGLLLDFGHSLYGGETPAEAARLAIARDKLFAIDVNDNFRGWDDDMVVGSVHLLETFEFFFALENAGWQGVWQLDQFPFREDPVEAARTGIRTMRAFHQALTYLDQEELAAAQLAQDALGAQRIAKRALFRALAESECA